MSHGWFIALAFQIALWMDTGVRLWMESLTRAGQGVFHHHRHGDHDGLVLANGRRHHRHDRQPRRRRYRHRAAGRADGDIFASLSIGVDKPFEIGDFVVFGRGGRQH